MRGGRYSRGKPCSRHRSIFSASHRFNSLSKPFAQRGQTEGTACWFSMCERSSELEGGDGPHLAGCASERVVARTPSRCPSLSPSRDSGGSWRPRRSIRLAHASLVAGAHMRQLPRRALAGLAACSAPRGACARRPALGAPSSARCVLFFVTLGQVASHSGRWPKAWSRGGCGASVARAVGSCGERQPSHSGTRPSRQRDGDGAATLLGTPQHLASASTAPPSGGATHGGGTPYQGGGQFPRCFRPSEARPRPQSCGEATTGRSHTAHGTRPPDTKCLGTILPSRLRLNSSAASPVGRWMMADADEEQYSARTSEFVSASTSAHK